MCSLHWKKRERKAKRSVNLVHTYIFVQKPSHPFHAQSALLLQERRPLFAFVAIFHAGRRFFIVGKRTQQVCNCSYFKIYYKELAMKVLLFRLFTKPHFIRFLNSHFSPKNTSNFGAEWVSTQYMQGVLNLVITSMI